MLDFVLIVAFFYFIVVGFYYGFVANLIRFIGVFLGIYFSIYTTSIIAKFLNKYFHIKIGYMGSGAILIAITFAIFLWFSFFLKGLIKDKIEENYRWKAIDRMMGGFTGFVVFIILIISVIRFSYEYPVLQEFISQSYFISILKKHF